MNFLPGTLVACTEQQAQVRLLDGTLLQAAVDARRLAPGTPVTLGLRPEDTQPGSHGQHLCREVLWQERLGDTTYVYLHSDRADRPWVVKADGRCTATAGQRLAFTLPADSLHLFDEQGWALERHVQLDDLSIALSAP